MLSDWNWGWNWRPVLCFHWEETLNLISDLCCISFINRLGVVACVLKQRPVHCNGTAWVSSAWRWILNALSAFKGKAKRTDDVQNCDSYINIHVLISQTTDIFYTVFFGMDFKLFILKLINSLQKLKSKALLWHLELTRIRSVYFRHLAIHLLFNNHKSYTFCRI